jgi:prepilin-type N-terminal cleavage/methylation domain-containing protein
MRKGFTLIEILIVIAILGIISVIVFGSFSVFRSSQGLDKDTDTVVEILRQARSQTLISKNASAYGVHVATTAVTLFSGDTYSAADPNNQVFTFLNADLVVSVTLTGGGSDVIFKRLTGETSQNGTIVLSTQGAQPRTRTITVFKTGLIEYQ